MRLFFRDGPWFKYSDLEKKYSDVDKFKSPVLANTLGKSCEYLIDNDFVDKLDPDRCRFEDMIEAIECVEVKERLLVIASKLPGCSRDVKEGTTEVIMDFINKGRPQQRTIIRSSGSLVIGMNDHEQRVRASYRDLLNSDKLLRVKQTYIDIIRRLFL